jgi:hypothetical protein
MKQTEVYMIQIYICVLPKMINVSTDAICICRKF